jgi:hypothetical protein
MSSRHRIQCLASASGMFALFSLVTFLAEILSHGEASTSELIAGNLIALFCAAAAWTGMIDSKGARPSTFSCGEWIATFSFTAILSFIMMLMDCGGRLPVFAPTFRCDGTPGFGVIFTLTAVMMTTISLPSALRAWMLEKLSKNGI